MAKKIKMVTRLGSQEFTVGECSPAQARILSKKDHGKLVDGKLLVSIRPFHLDVAINDFAAGGMSIAPRDPNVSDAELERRLDWFKTLLGTGTLAQIPRGSELDKILSVHKGFAGVKHLFALTPDEIAALTPEERRFHRVNAVGGGSQFPRGGVDPHYREPITDEWADSLFVDDGRFDDPGPIETKGHREVPEAVFTGFSEEEEGDYRACVKVAGKVSFNLKGSAVSRGVYPYKGNDDGYALTGIPWTTTSQEPPQEDAPDVALDTLLNGTTA